MGHRIEEVTSKAMGAAKSAKGAITGLSGVFRHLAKEHGEVSALLNRVAMSSDAGVARELFSKIRKELLSHERGELKVVFPALRQHPKLVSIADEHDIEAGQLEQSIDRLDGLAFEDPAWKPAFEELVDMVKQHVSEEENDWFKRASDELTDDEADRLLERYESAKSAVMSQLGKA